MAMREFLLYPDIPVDEPDLQTEPMEFPQVGSLPEANNTPRIGYIPIQSTSYSSAADSKNGYLDGPPKLHIISVSDKEFYVTRIRGTPRFNPGAKSRVAKKRNSVLKRQKETTFCENEITSYSDDGNNSEKHMALDRSQENYGLIYPKSSPRKVPAPRILSRFNPRHWAERPVLKSQVSTANHHGEASVDDAPDARLVADQEQLTLYSSLSPYG